MRMAEHDRGGNATPARPFAARIRWRRREPADHERAPLQGPPRSTAGAIAAATPRANPTWKALPEVGAPPQTSPRDIRHGLRPRRARADPRRGTPPALLPMPGDSVAW